MGALMKLNVKDRVILRGTNKLGTIVLVMLIGKYKVLWDDDWISGRTFIYSPTDLDRFRI